MKIQKLSEDLARKIAAGEVIERPASVVKELLENALDAKSESIDITLEEGGIRSIIVRDAGEGMDIEDLRLCVGRHATSKIKTEEDLTSITTLGFRGEALASIGAVARMQIVSRPPASEEAYEIRVAGGAILGPFPVARAPGTTVEVRDLFFNLPARARFLGAPRTEFFHINRVVHRLALASPAVSWSLHHGQRSVLEAPSAETLLDRIAQIYGHEVARALIPIASDQNEIGLSGYISRHDLKRGNRRDQLFCVNGRPVTDRGLSFVLASCYQGILRQGTYPLAVVRIDVPAARVDVNVHPRKEEIRFSEPKRVYEALDRALKEALSSRHVVSPLLRTRQQPERRGENVSEKVLPFDVKAEIAARKTVREQEKVRVSSDRRVIGQLLRTYLLVETPEGLEIVDQHIAHERILYEGLQNEFRDREVARQRFLLPVRVELPFESAEVLLAAKEELEQVGVSLDDFGGGTFLLREYPTLLAEAQSQYGFQEVIERLVEIFSQGESLRDALFDRLLMGLACEAAIKAGTELPLAEQQALVERLMALKNPYTCPHGRPIVFTISKEELDRRFQRS
jgi:DNA mismatch repair protein MutL